MENDETKARPIEILGMLFTALVGIITLIFSYRSPETGVSLLIGIFIVIGVYFLTDFLIAIAKRKLAQIDKNTQDISIIKKELKELNDRLNFHSEIARLKARVEHMENESRKRKGAIDPRIVILIILVILLFLYLRTIGLI